eukprot:XP_011664958.1 PREDICTED: uncharacterized protein LOC105438623 [Strongylocentrotus purpuratus]
MTSNRQQDTSISLPDINTSDKLAIANAINSYFVSIGKDTPSLDLSEIPAFRPIQLDTLPTIQPWTVYRELSKTPVGKSGGPDGISPRLIREFAVELSSPLCDIFNASFQQSRVPSHWKRSIMFLFPKKLLRRYRSCALSP